MARREFRSFESVDSDRLLAGCFRGGEAIGVSGRDHTCCEPSRDQRIARSAVEHAVSDGAPEPGLHGQGGLGLLQGGFELSQPRLAGGRVEDGRGERVATRFVFKQRARGIRPECVVRAALVKTPREDQGGEQPGDRP